MQRKSLYRILEIWGLSLVSLVKQWLAISLTYQLMIMIMTFILCFVRDLKLLFNVLMKRTFLTVVESKNNTRTRKSTNELCSHVNWEFFKRKFSQDNHGQWYSRVHVSSCNTQIDCTPLYNSNVIRFISCFERISWLNVSPVDSVEMSSRLEGPHCR